VLAIQKDWLLTSESQLATSLFCYANAGSPCSLNWRHSLVRSKELSASSKSLVLIACVLAMAALYFGRQIFIPLALAVVFSFLLTPLVGLLERIHFGRVPAVCVVLALAFVMLGTVTWAVAGQMVEIMVDFPDYKANLDNKIHSLHLSHDGHLSKATATVQELNKELSAVPGELSSGHVQSKDQAAARPVHPISVEVAAPPSNLVQDLRALLGPLAGPVETAAIVIIFTVFMMVKREDLRNRAIRLAGRGQLNLMTQALDDAGRRLSRYLLLQFLVNSGYGLLFGIALYFTGVPHALLWGVLAALLRFIPYIGTLIAAAFPVAMALAVSPGWHQAAIAFGVFVVLELAVSNVIEPILYGSHTGISSLAVLVAAVFWATLWGPVGLILSTPLTVCLMVLGRYVPQLNFLEIVLGDEPVLPPEQQFYQRLLAMDQEEARTIAESHLKGNPLESLYESVFVPALRLAEQDHHVEGLDDDTRAFIFQSTRDLIEDLGDRLAEERPPENSKSDAFGQLGQTQTAATNINIACLPARNGADELVAVMLAQLLRKAGYRASELRAGTVDDMLAAVSQQEFNVVCVSSLPPYPAGQARTICKRLQAVVPPPHVIVGLWNLEGGVPAAQARLGAACSSVVTTTLADAREQVQRFGESLVSAEELAEP
jgi:predicted PurR-regulated permease PerM